MLVDVVSVTALPDYKLDITFADGKRGIYDMAAYLEKGVFRRLRNVAFFNLARVDYGTVTWPTDLDVAPETLYQDCVPVT